MATNRALSIEDGDLGQVTIATTRNREYVDLDFAFDKKPTSGELYKKRDAAAVRQAVKNLLLTNQNEKPFQPFFGGDLNSFLFELAEVDSADEIEQQIRTAIEVYEPRVDSRSLDIRVNIEPDNNALSITVVFRVINTNEVVEFTTTLNRLR